MSEPRKTRHHYVPRFYLEGFTVGDPAMLWVYDKETGGKRQASTRDAGIEKHYHSITRADGTRDSETIEAAFADFESDTASGLRAIRAGAMLNNDDRGLVASFMAVQLARVPLARRNTETILRATAEMIGRPMIESQLVGPADQQWETTKRMLQWFKDRGLPPLSAEDVIVKIKPEATLAGLLQAGKLAQLFYEMSWAIVPANGRYSFVTSDNPVVYGPASPGPPVGLASPSAVVVFPLSSTLCLFANWQPGRGQWNVPRRKVSEARVVALNKRIVAGAQRFVYSDQDSDGLSRLVERHRGSAPRVVFDGPNTGGAAPVSF